MKRGGNGEHRRQRNQPGRGVEGDAHGLRSQEGKGRVKIEELNLERGRFYVTVEYGEPGQTRIDYKTCDLKKAFEFPFHTNRNDAIKEIKIVRAPAD